MNKIVHLTIANKSVPTIIDVVQSATDPQITFIIDDWEPLPNSSARIYIKKDGGEVYNNCTMSGNQITFAPSPGSFDVYGTSVAQLQILSGSRVALSFLIFVRVEENIILGSAAKASTEYDALTSLVRDAQKWDDVVGPNNWTGVRSAFNWSIISTNAGNLDLNGITDFGVYYCNSVTTAGNVLNRPPINASIFRLEVQGHVPNSSKEFTAYIEQRYYTGSYIYRRITEDGGTTWGPWRNATNSAVPVSDINNATLQGNYTYDAGALNLPDGLTLGGCLYVNRYSSTNIVQILFPNGNVVPPKIFARRMYSGTWLDWYLLNTTYHINNLTNLNDAIQNGEYTYAANTTNAPSTAAGAIKVMRYNNNYVVQIAYEATTNDEYIRRKFNTTWGPWRLIVTDGSTLSESFQFVPDIGDNVVDIGPAGFIAVSDSGDEAATLNDSILDFTDANGFTRLSAASLINSNKTSSKRVTVSYDGIEFDGSAYPAGGLNLAKYVTGNSETFTLGPWYGYITGKNLTFFIPTTKEPNKTTGLEITRPSTIIVRGVSGYINGSQNLDISDENVYTLSATARSNGITVTITSTNAFTNVVDQTPISVRGTFTVRFV